MKQDEETIEKKLSDLFDVARSEKNPLGHSGLPALPGQPHKASFRNRLLNIKTILMTTSIATAGVIAALAFLTHSGPKPPKLSLKEKTPDAPMKDIGDTLSSERFKNGIPLPEIPSIPEMPAIQPIPQLPSIPSVSSVPSLPPVPPIPTTSITPLSPTDDVLKRLGVTVSFAGISVLHWGDAVMCYTQAGVVVLDRKTSSCPDPISKQIVPMLVTDDLGKNWRSFSLTEVLELEFKKLYPDVSIEKDINDYDEALQEFVNSKIANLVPVLARMPEGWRKPIGIFEWRPDIIIWYEATDTLKAILNMSDTPQPVTKKPETTVNQIETTTITTPGEETNHPATISNEYAGLYPNPATDQTTLTYHLERTKKVSIAMHDISGKLINVYAKGETRNAGENKLTINVKDLVPGMYLISIQTEDGNILTQRLIKQ